MALEWEQVLRDVISEVLETMFFAMVDFEEGGGAGRSFDYESEIHLLNHEGRIAISLRVSEEFARMITANFLGIEENQVKDDDTRRQPEGTGKYGRRRLSCPASMIRTGNWEYPGSGRSGSEGVDTIQAPARAWLRLFWRIGRFGRSQLFVLFELWHWN